MSDQLSLEKKLWLEVSILAIALFGLWITLLSPALIQGQVLFVLLSTIAGTSGVLLAMSLSLSSFAYYFDFLDSKVIYRKYLGLMGYFFALAYAISSAVLSPQIYLTSFPQNVFDPTIGLAMLSMVIFTLMALISNRKALQVLGPKHWKTILGLGYIAYAFLVIRGILLDSDLWRSWFLGNEATFTVRMFLTVLGIAVLCFRTSVPFHQKFFTPK